MLPLLDASELFTLQNTANLVLVDVRNSKTARADYKENHLEGAIFIDINTQLSDIKKDVALGGRHPLPTLEQFSKTLSESGISKDSHVVIYDDKSGANAAARFWWMLKAIGHNKVQVLNGGMQKAVRIGFPLQKGEVKPVPAAPYIIQEWALPLADIHEVENASQTGLSTVIDVREPARYRGETEPIDLIAGHIPGAINIPFSSNLDDEGFFLAPDQLKELYQNIFDSKQPKELIVHCGSGVTACHTLLVMHAAGFEIPKLYIGSWSEWSRNHKPIAKG